MSHICGKQHTGSQGLGQNQHVSRLHAAFLQHGFLTGQTVDGKSERQFAALTGMPPDQSRVFPVENLQSPGHELGELVLDLVFQAIRDGDHRQGGLRLCAHGKDIAQGVSGRDLTEDKRVFNKGSKKINGLHHGFSGRDGDHCRIVRRVQANNDIGAFNRLKARQGLIQDRTADFGPAATTPHGKSGNLFEDLSIGQTLLYLGGLVVGHIRQLIIFADKAPVDPIFPSPDPLTFIRPARP